MPNVNKVILMGNLTREPEINYTSGGTAVCDITIATNRTYRDADENKQEETTFSDVTFWGRKAEVIGEYVKKGHPLYIEGRLTLDTWEDKETGQKRSKLKITGETFEFIQARSDSQPAPSRPAPSRPAPSRTETPASSNQRESYEIPF